MRLPASLRLLRPKQWIKNLLVFAALIFAQAYDDPGNVMLAVWAFVAFCLISSAVYSINDVLDADRDKLHPTKRARPIASGELSPGKGIAISVICLTLGGAVAIFVGPSFSVVLFSYLALQFLYNLKLKSMPVLDVFTVSAGFVFRAVAGAFAIGVPISGWLLFCTGTLALLLASSKRRHEFHTQGEARADTRAALSEYTGPFLDTMVLFAASLSTISYGIYAIESPKAIEHPLLLLTIPIVAYGVLRYLFLVFVKSEGGEPETIVLSDAHMISVLILFIATVFFAFSGVDIPILTVPTGSM
ncbi:MAG: decaprenyl-phosphate phosphoribosyltransferase [Armatimonadetes bacterium]|nr:decaprenyl-phosphate phosphoribosyltransferase [Armatimonadota bacterium]